MATIQNGRVAFSAAPSRGLPSPAQGHDLLEAFEWSGAVLGETSHTCSLLLR